MLLANRQGLFRLWVATSVAWIAAIAWFYQAEPSFSGWPDRCETLKPKIEDPFMSREGCFEDKGAAQSHKQQVMFLPPLLLLAIWGSAVWVSRGFSEPPK
jgi:hypothetical protein